MSERTRWSRPLAAFDLARCSYRGRILDLLEPNQSVEERFFPGWPGSNAEGSMPPGWRNAWTPSLGRMNRHKSAALSNLVDDEGRPALEWCADYAFLLMAGDASWSDYEVSCDVRCLATRCFPFFHDEMTHDFQGRTGLAFRVQDSRRHYFSGFQDGRRLVIAARDDANWIVLNHVDFEVDRRRFYRLSVRCEGDRIEVSVDGRKALVTQDGRWTRGPAGVYTTTPTRWLRAQVRCTATEERAIRSRRKADAAALAKVSRAVPQARMVGEIPLPLKPGETAVFGGVLNEKTGALLIQWTGEGRTGLLAVTAAGKEIWRRDLAAAAQPVLFKAADIDLDGTPEIVALNGQEILVLDGSSGAVKARSPYPAGCPFIRYRGEKGSFAYRNPYLWHTGGRNKPARIYLFEGTGAGGYTIISLDHRLRKRWVHHNYAGKMGHNIQSYDVNGDGRAEVVAGYYALDDRGRVVWRVKDQDLIFKQDHTDNLFVGPMGPNGTGIPKIVAACGEAGALFLDARNGEVLVQRRSIGHLQRLAVGRFRHDLPGLQAWVWSDWGAAGIYYLFDEFGNLLHRFQPDPLMAVGEAVAWWPDGRQLLLIQGTRAAQGLWDAFGRRVVDLFDLRGIPGSCKPGTASRTRPAAGAHMANCAFRVCRFPGSATDQLVAVDGARLILVGPDLHKHS